MIGSTAATVSAPASLRGRGQRLEVLDRAEEVRVLDEDRGGLVVDAPAASAAASVSAALEPDLDHLGAEAPGVGAERLAAVRVDAARDDEPAAPLVAPIAR